MEEEIKWDLPKRMPLPVEEGNIRLITLQVTAVVEKRTDLPNWKEEDVDEDGDVPADKITFDREGLVFKVLPMEVEYNGQETIYIGSTTCEE